MSSFFFSVFILLVQQRFAEFALRKPAYQSSYERRDHDASVAVDGVTRGSRRQRILTSEKKPYTCWEVDLQKSFFIFDVKVYFNSNCKWHKNGVQVYTNTKERQANTGHLCGTITGKPDGSDIADITSVACDVTARYVTVYQGTDNGESTMLDFVEVEVYSCKQNKNYARNCNKLCRNRHCLSSNAPCNVQTGDCGTDGCELGWNGTDCTQDVDECKISKCVGNDDCDNSDEYSGNSFTIDDSDADRSTNNCSKNADCINRDGSYTCSCHTGYSGDGFTCTDVDECKSSNCAGNDDCDNSDEYSGNGFTIDERNKTLT